MALYDVVDGIYRKVAKKYDPVEGVYRKVTKAFDPVNGVYRQYFSGATPVSTLAVGDSVWLNVDGVQTEFLVVHQGNPDSTLYDASCDGTWLMSVKTDDTLWQFSSSYSYYDLSSMPSVLNAFYARISRQDAIKEVKIPYRSHNGLQGGSNGYQCHCFIPTAKEVNCTKYVRKNGSIYYIDHDSDGGTCLDYFVGKGDSDRIAYNGKGSQVDWWTRTIVGDGYVVAVNYLGEAHQNSITNGSNYIRPMLIIHSDTPIDPETHTIVT